MLQFFENPKLKLGNLTDCSLKYDPLTGNFRRFAFVGFKRPDAAELAVQKLNKSFIGSSRIQVMKLLCFDYACTINYTIKLIQVEICRPLKLQPTPDSSSLVCSEIFTVIFCIFECRNDGTALFYFYFII